MNKTFKCIASEITELHYRWVVFRNVYAVDQNHIEILNELDGSFFGTVQGLYWDAIILHIIKLTDPMKTGSNLNLTLERVWNEYKDEISDASNHELKEIMSNISKAKKHLKTHRSKRLAHLDYKYGTDKEAFELGGISRADIKQILSLIRDFMNKIQGEIENTTTMYEGIIGVDGGTTLFRNLKMLGADGADFS